MIKKYKYMHNLTQYKGAMVWEKGIKVEWGVKGSQIKPLGYASHEKNIIRGSKPIQKKKLFFLNSIELDPKKFMVKITLYLRLPEKSYNFE